MNAHTRGLLAVIAILLCCFPTRHVRGADVPDLLTPDSVIQKRLSDLDALRAKADHSSEAAGLFLKAVRDNELEFGRTPEDRIHLIQQLMLYCRISTPNTEAPLYLLLLTRWPNLGGSRDWIASAAPILDLPDGAIDAKLLSSVRVLALGAQENGGGRDLKFGASEEYFKSHFRTDKEEGSGLLALLMEESPEHALATIANAHNLHRSTGGRAILWASHTIEDWYWQYVHEFVREPANPTVTAQLELIAEREEWCARLYAVQMMRYAPLRNSALMQRLSKDTHPRVKKTAEDVLEGRLGGRPDSLR